MQEAGAGHSEEDIVEKVVASAEYSGAKNSTSLTKKLGYVVLNAWLMFHLAAIFISPLSVEPAAPIAQNAWRITGPYAQIMYMNHGYHFFAPNPGGSMILNYEVEHADGTTTTGMYPHKGIYPRLLYHRHFMLTEYMNQIERFPPELKASVYKAYAKQICKEHAGEKVTLTKTYHDVPSMERVLAGGTLDDPDLYFKEPVGTYTWADF